MTGMPYGYETLFGASPGYAYGYDAGYGGGYPHGSFIIWLAVFTLAALAILGGLKVGGFHFVVKV
jgi:hypothetical protein